VRVNGLVAMACPSCALGQGRGEVDSLLVVGGLILLPLVIALVAGAVIAHLLRRPSE
jgi:hypothetical protein